VALKVTFLGTGTSQGIPLIACRCAVCTSTDPRDKRLRSSIMVESAKTRIVVDSGPDFRQQLLRERVRSLDAVVFTHEHKDHIAGLDDVRAFNFISGGSMAVFATQRVQDALKREFAYIFSGEKYPGIPQVDLYSIDDEVFHVGDLVIEPLNVLHYRLPVKAFRSGDFAYITDANFIPDATREKLQGLKVLVVNALRREPHISHFNLSEAIQLVSELKPEKTYLTHLSHQMGRHQELLDELPSFIEPGIDGMQIIV
jgi:phosphoribosyl 1,2-cyclic phosphate phosphodiesterase